MSKFYLDEKNHPDRDDLQGAEYKNEGSARQEAIMRIRSSGMNELQDKLSIDAIEVKDDSGNLIYRATSGKSKG
jgi:hypothetical protein